MEENLILEENLLSTLPAFKLYDNIAIRIGTFLGGPLATGYLMAENFKQLGQEDKVKNTWIISIIATIVICTIAVLVPKDFPGYILPVLYTGIASYLVQRFQDVQIKFHIEEGGQLYSRWRAALVALVGLLLIVVICAAIFIVLGIKA
jgi:hypothetical protein